MAAEAPGHYEDKRHEPRYDLSPDELERVCRSFIEDRIKKDPKAEGDPNKPEGLLNNPYSCHMIDGADPYADLARNVETDVIGERFNNSPSLLKGLYAPSENQSVFFLILNHVFEEFGKADINGARQRRLARVQPVGEMRIILPGNGLMSLVDLQLHGVRSRKSERPGETGEIITPDHVYQSYDIDPSKCIDIGTLAVKDGYRSKVGHIPTLLLFRSFYLQYLNSPDFIRPEKYSHVVAIMDLEAKRVLDAMKMPFHTILGSDPIPYLDTHLDGPKTLSQPIIARTDEFYPAVTQWTKKLAAEVKRLQEFIDEFRAVAPEEFYDCGVSIVDEIEDANRRIAKDNTLVMGMELLEKGRFGEGESVFDIDQMLATPITQTLSPAS